ncbi:MAG: hypothetical protein K0A94_12035 [Desulfuromonadales bacterium]|nr:hypothetical protein [Desulfuromonadales bacterium]
MIFAQLQAVMNTAQDEQELPDYLAEQVQFIIDHPERFLARKPEIQHLIEQVEHYDTYGQTGYLGMGVNNVILGNTLKRLLDA